MKTEVRHDVVAPACRVAIALLACSLIVVAGGGVDRPAKADTSGLSYQQVTRVMFNQTATPAPGSYSSGTFSGDFQAASAGFAPKKGGLLGMLKWAKSAMGVLNNGFAVTESYWNGMSREDKPDQTASIEIPAKNERIELNLATKTYSIIDETPKANEGNYTPEPMPTMPNEPQPSPQPGTAKVNVSTTITDLGPKTLDNEQTEGYEVATNIVSSQATGSCSNGSVQAATIEFVSNYSQPSVAARPMPKMTMPTKMPAMPSGASLASVMSALKRGCVPTFTSSVQRGATIPYNRLTLWQYFGGSGTMQGSSTGSMGRGSGGFGTIIERGSVRTLGPADASLFAVPAGFTQVPPSGD